MSNTKVTVQDLADAFAQLDAGEGWDFARIVACSVEKGAGVGVNSGTGDKRFTAGATAQAGKVSANRFADMAGTDHKRVIRLLAAWNFAADMGLCQKAEDLNPNDNALTVNPPSTRWAEIYAASNAKLKEANLGAAEDAASVLRQKHEQEEEARRAEDKARIEAREAALVRQIELSKHQYALDLEKEKIKAEKMAAQKADIAARNAKAMAEAVAKEDARRAHRAAETRKQEAVLRAASEARANFVAEQKAKAAKAEAEQKAKAAEALAKMSAAEVKAHNVLVREMLALHGKVAESNLGMADDQMGRYISQHEKIVGHQDVRVHAA